MSSFGKGFGATLGVLAALLFLGLLLFGGCLGGCGTCLLGVRQAGRMVEEARQKNAADLDPDEAPEEGEGR